MVWIKLKMFNNIKYSFSFLYLVLHNIGIRLNEVILWIVIILITTPGNGLITYNNK